MSNGKIPIGTATVLGLSSGAAADAAAVAAFVAGDHSEQTLGVIAGGVMAAVLWLATMIGRYSQAKALAAKPAPPVAFTGSSGAGGKVIYSGAAASDLYGGGKEPNASEVVADEEELSNVPRPGSAQTPATPEGEEASDPDVFPPLEPGDYEEG